MPHVLAVSWMYREDYARAGFRMLSSRDVDGASSGRQSVLFAFLLLIVSCLPAWLGLASRNFMPLEALAGVGFLIVAVRFYLKRDVARARRLFIASIIYLPLLLALLVLTKS